jgi:hypothetical protein
MSGLHFIHMAFLELALFMSIYIIVVTDSLLFFYFNIVTDVSNPGPFVYLYALCSLCVS